ncbi:DUF3775 domain-containing protein [Falsiroseomonas sp.]|uniref:DUF3775 domain-containing protein n=1 Tax=Falsiroseomonas sp. TaxID=2870721 RepID=UPI0027247E38|nr:DUF3775 domain-containing protein [Falsiroseomonas sp.]MDO9503158.1 DUF3775 domain-containing protein [Falsiroseomonas sp.]MDP3417543.1 DUF3775 domain-containing protein [Falsiroseomonas sp.]
MAEASEDDLDLGISLEVVATLVDQARAVQGTEVVDLDAEAETDPDTGAVEDEFDEDSLRAAILALNEDEQAALIALALVGRGDFTAEEWEEALEQAADRDGGEDAAELLLGMDNFGDLLAEGVAAFGLSLEDVER